MADLFTAKAPGIMRRLMADLTIGADDAAAILGNIGVETGGFALRLEQGRPLESQGFGWSQWTGPRRLEFEQWCSRQGINLDGSDAEYDEGCYRFLVHELTATWEKRALPALRAADGLDEKTLVFMRLYERPGTPHADRRVAMARQAIEAFRGAPGSAPFKISSPGPALMTIGPGGIAIRDAAVPDDWMPRAVMHKIVVHWTAGGHRASATDRSHYHVLIEGDGQVVRGAPSIAANQPPLQAGYAAHTLNCNSNAIGVSMCAMAGAVERPFSAGRAPLTKAQWDKMVQVVAVLCRRYGIKVTPQTVLSHAEVQANLGIAQRGKWDVAILPFDPAFDTAAKCGARLRSEVQAVLARSALVAPPPAAKSSGGLAPAPDAPKTGDGKAVTAVVGGGGALALLWTFLRDYMPEIILGLAAAAALALVGFRIIKGRWPWTGKTSASSLHPPRPESAGYSADSSDPLARSLALQRDVFLAMRSASPPSPTPSPTPSEPTPKPAPSSPPPKRRITKRSKPRPTRQPSKPRPSTKRSARKTPRA